MQDFMIAIQIVIIVLFIYFVSGRLIGTNVNVFRRILSVLISIVFTTFVFWYTYLRDKSIEEFAELDMMNVITLLWIGSMLLISMFLYLVFELFDPIALNENGQPLQQQSIMKKYASYWRQQKRLRQVVSIAVKNGVTQTERKSMKCIMTIMKKLN